jgi:uncharacterized protein (TIGR04222 family)
MFPQDDSGPDFLAVWLLGWVAVLAITLVVRDALKRPPGPTVGVDDLGADELAYLIGGAPRAILAATTGLLRRGEVVAHDGRLALGATPPPTVVAEGAYRGHAAAPAGPPAERHVLARLPTSVASLLDDAPALDAEYVSALRAKGLLVDRPHGRVELAAPSLVWITVGVAQVGDGLAVGQLLPGLVVAAVVLFARVPWRTTAGDAVASAAHHAHHGLRSTAPDQLDDVDAVLACALFGPSAAPPALAAVAAPALAPFTSTRLRTHRYRRGGCGDVTCAGRCRPDLDADGGRCRCAMCRSRAPS